MWDLIGRVKWDVRTPETAPLIPEKINFLVNQLFAKLKNYRFRENSVRAGMDVLDEPWHSGFTKTRCVGGWHMKFHVYDSSEDDGVRCRNYNFVVRAGIMKELLALQLGHYKTVLKIVDVTFS